MKLGKNFGFWIQLILAVLRALVPFSKVEGESIQEPGERVARAVLGVAVKLNEDDDIDSLEALEN